MSYEIGPSFHQHYDNANQIITQPQYVGLLDEASSVKTTCSITTAHSMTQKRQRRKHVSWASGSQYKQVYVIVQDKDDEDAAWYHLRELRAFKRECRRACQWAKQVMAAGAAAAAATTTKQQNQQQLNQSFSSSSSCFSDRGLEHFIYSNHRIRRRKYKKESIQAVLRGQAWYRNSKGAAAPSSSNSQEQEQQVAQFHLRLSMIYQTYGSYAAQQDALDFGRMDALVAQRIHDTTTQEQQERRSTVVSSSKLHKFLSKTCHIVRPAISALGVITFTTILQQQQQQQHQNQSSAKIMAASSSYGLVLGTLLLATSLFATAKTIR